MKSTMRKEPEGEKVPSAPEENQIPQNGESSTAVFRTQFACLSLHMNDRIRVVQFPEDIRDMLATTIAQAWPRGIQDARLYYGAQEWKLKGNPWLGSGDEATLARRLICTLFRTLFDHGWVLSLSTDVSKKLADKDTLIFRHQLPAPRPCDWMFISFSRGDRLRIADAPPGFIASLTEVLSPLVQRHKPYRMPGVYEFKIKGWPWFATEGETVSTRILLLKLMAELEAYGYTVYASIDQKGPGSNNGNQHKGDADTWYCCRPQGWAPGLPVYHA